MGLDVADRGGCDLRIAKGAAHDRALRRAARRGQTVRASILIDRGASDHGANVIAVAQRVRVALEHDQTAALAAHVAVRVRIEGLAAPVRGHHSRLVEPARGVRGQDQVHASGEREAALLLSQALARLVDRD